MSNRELLGEHLRARIPALLDAWRRAVAADPLLTTKRSLPRRQLDDHLPRWLDDFATVLGGSAQATSPAPDGEPGGTAEAHGVQRWQQGYDLHEVTREWSWLHRVLVGELEAFFTARPEVAAEIASETRQQLAEQMGEAISASAREYFRLEQISAAGAVADLERALADVHELERRRAALWREAAHDLRGNLGVVSNVAQGLAFDNLPADRRLDFLGLLRHNVTALRELLDDVTELARLQAGQEQRRIDRFDAAALLQRLASDMQPMADARGLFVKTSGPDAFEVDGDAVKVRRIAQNLLLNALKYTRSGGVTVTWGAPSAADAERWRFEVEDTGPGFHAAPVAPIADALDRSASTPASPSTQPTPSTAATQESQAAQAAQAAQTAHATDDTQATQLTQATQVHGEGIGLAIVKRLCDLLDAAVDIESRGGRGTCARVLLPRCYPPADA